jgi:hypothetical protein
MRFFFQKSLKMGKYQQNLQPKKLVIFHGLKLKILKEALQTPMLKDPIIIIN